MPVKTSAKTHKRRGPKSRTKPRKSKPRKRTARKNGRRGKPTRRKRMRGGGPKPKSTGKATGSETESDSEPENITGEQFLEQLEHTYKYSDDSREEIKEDLEGYDNSTRAGRERIKSYYEDIQERIEDHITNYLSDQHAEELKDMKKEHDEENDKYSEAWRNPTSRYIEHQTAEAWGNAEDDQRATHRMVENHHSAQYARMDNMIIKRWDRGWRQAVDDYKPPVAAAGAGRQRTLTDILSEDYSVPSAAHNMANGFFEDDDLYARGMIEDWEKAWDKADEEEYKASAEYTRDQERKRKEDAKKAKEEEKRKRTEAERDAERARIAALPPRVSAKDRLKERMRQQMRNAAEASSRGQRPLPSAQAPAPPAPPVAPPAAPPAAPPTPPSMMPVAIANQIIAANNGRFILKSSTSKQGQQYLQDTNQQIASIWIEERPTITRANATKKVQTTPNHTIHPYYETGTYYMMNTDTGQRAWIQE